MRLVLLRAALLLAGAAVILVGAAAVGVWLTTGGRRGPPARGLTSVHRCGYGRDHARRRRRRPRRQWSLITLAVVGLFSWSNSGRRDGSGRGEAVPPERRRGRPGPGGGARVGARRRGEDGRPEVLRPARVVAAHDAPTLGVPRERLRRGPRLRRLVDSRLAGDLRERHAAHAAGGDGRAR